MKKIHSYDMSRPVKLGSKVKVDYAPGAFITPEGLEDMMLEQKRAMIGGARTYGSEYDGYYQDRRWALKSKLPTFTPLPTKASAKATVKQAAQAVAKRIVDKAKQDVAAAQAAGFGLGASTSDLLAQKIIERSRESIARSMSGERSDVHTAFLSPAEIQSAPFFSGLGADEKEMPKPEDVDVVTAVKEIYSTIYDLKPVTDVVSAHPIGTIAVLMMVIGAWAGLASFIGAGGVDAVKQLAGKKG